MKKIFIVLLIFCIALSVYAVNLSLGCSFDLSSLWVRPLSIGADVRVDILSSLRIRLPITFDKGDFRNLFTTSVVIDYSPFDRYTGIFFGFAVAEIGFLYHGSKLQMIFLNELQVGLRQSLFDNYCFIETILCVRDPTFAFSSSLKEIQSSISSYSRVKFRINIGVNFDLYSKKNIKKTTKNTGTKKNTSTKKK